METPDPVQTTMAYLERERTEWLNADDYLERAAHYLEINRLFEELGRLVICNPKFQ